MPHAASALQKNAQDLWWFDAVSFIPKSDVSRDPPVGLLTLGLQSIARVVIVRIDATNGLARSRASFYSSSSSGGGGGGGGGGDGDSSSSATPTHDAVLCMQLGPDLVFAFTWTSFADGRRFTVFSSSSSPSRVSKSADKVEDYWKPEVTLTAFVSGVTVQRLQLNRVEVGINIENASSCPICFFCLIDLFSLRGPTTIKHR
jgi:hypothetical protein